MFHFFKNKRIFVALSFLACSFLFFIFNANASTVYLKSTNTKLVTSEVFRVDFMINTENKNINAFESNIVFDTDFLDIQKVYSSNTTVDFWMKSPRSQGNKIFFSGITPGGYSGDNAKIMSVLFVAKKIGTTNINIENGKFLLNDDNGTEDNITVNNLLITISDRKTIDTTNTKTPDKTTDTTSNTNINNTTPITDDNQTTIDNSNQSEDVIVKDTTRPEDFTIRVIKDDKISIGKFSIIFYAQDKDSGISHYEIKEGDDEFVTAESPYVLKYQDLTKEIQVKAVDLDGNYRIEKTGPFIVNEKKSVISYKIIIISLLFIIFMLILLNTYLNRRNKLKNEKNNII